MAAQGKLNLDYKGSILSFDLTNNVYGYVEPPKINLLLSGYGVELLTKVDSDRNFKFWYSIPRSRKYCFIKLEHDEDKVKDKL